MERVQTADYANRWTAGGEQQPVLTGPAMGLSWTVPWFPDLDTERFFEDALAGLSAVVGFERCHEFVDCSQGWR